MKTEIKCKNCGTIYNIDVPTWLDQISNIITCPICGSTIYIRADEIYEKGE